MQKAGEDFAILGDREKCCGLYAFDLGFRREYERLKDANLATLTHAGVKKVIVACGSCQRIWREYAKEASGFEVMHGVEFVAQAVQSWAAQVYQADRQESNLPRFLSPRPRLRCLRSAAANSPGDSWPATGRDGAQPALGLVLRRRWRRAGGRSRFGAVERSGPHARSARQRRRINADFERAVPTVLRRIARWRAADRRFTRIYFAGALDF